MNSILEKISSKLEFDPTELIARLTTKFTEMTSDEIKQILLDTIYIVLNYIHTEKICNDLETTLYDMTIEYYYASQRSEEDGASNIKSVSRGDVKTEFYEAKSMNKYAAEKVVNNFSIMLNSYRKIKR